MASVEVKPIPPISSIIVRKSGVNHLNLAHNRENKRILWTVESSTWIVKNAVMNQECLKLRSYLEHELVVKSISILKILVREIRIVNKAVLAFK